MPRELSELTGIYLDLSRIAWSCRELSGFVGNRLELHENLRNCQTLPGIVGGKREEEGGKKEETIRNYLEQ